MMRHSAKTNHDASRARAGRRLLAGLMLAGTLFLGVAAPLPAMAAMTNHLTISGSEIGATQRLQIDLNKSVIVDLPRNAREVIVSQPSIATAIMRTKRRAIIQGIANGATNIFFLDDNGRRIAVLDIAIIQEPSKITEALESTLARSLPGNNISVEAVDVGGSSWFSSSTSRVVLSGTAQSTDDIQKAIEIAAQFAGGEDNVASVITVAGPQQVMLKVTVAEVSREAIKQLGVNLSASIGGSGLTGGLLSTQPVGGASGQLTSNGINFGVDIGAVSIQAAIQALERRGAVRTLAEPTLTAISGQEAEFMAGGEYPVPIAVDEDCNVSFTFKKFGVGLKFTPVLKSDGVIALTVDTSVSEITTEGGFQACGVTIPATTERTARTSLEMRPGTTLVIAGLLQEKIRQQINELPGLGSIPILGALFRSRDYIRSQTELLILVTPYMATAGRMPTLPTDKITFAGDAETIFLGHMEKLYGVGDDTGNGGYQGNFGFVLD